MKIKVTSVMVQNQDKALKFYTDVLGFVKKRDIPLGEARWLTVVSKEEQDKELMGNKLTYFIKNGKVKAKGSLIKDKMEGEWNFYRETGQLWQVGNFKNDKNNGTWLQYDKNDKLEFQESFNDNKIV